jgi:5'-3' exoribonuclease 1
MVIQELMYSPHSPIKDFYPDTFELDMNGKKQEWEAIVKIPFIEQRRLLTSMASKCTYLTSACACL